jgi:hypothetical protein
MRSSIGEPFQSAIFAGLPPIAVPITVKMPDPITAPIPSAVSETGPSVFFNACSGLSDSEISLSIDFVAKICLASALAPANRRIGAGRFNCNCVTESERDCHHLRVRSAESTTSALPAQQNAYRLLWPREAFLTLALFSPRAPVRGPFGAAFLRAARFTFLRSSLSVMLLVFAMYVANLSLGAIFQNSEALQLGELLHQLLHAVLLKLYCNLRIIPIAFATKDGALAILRMPDARSLL